MAALRAVLLALSLVAIVIIYSDIIEDEANFDTEEADTTAYRTKKDAHITEYDYDRLLEGESGSFVSPNYPTADHNLDYVWLIQVAPGKTIRLNILDFDTESGYDHIFVHDGETIGDPILMVLSGLHTPPAIRSSTNKMLVRFITDNKVTSRGFHANYFAIFPCSLVLYASSGIITSHNYPSNYDSNMQCDWLIAVGASERILLEFIDVSTEKDYDTIQIYDGESDRAPFLDRISGDHKDSTMIRTSTSNFVLIRFTTDNCVSNSGFSAKYTAGSVTDLIQYVHAEYPDYFKSSEDSNTSTDKEQADGDASLDGNAITDDDLVAFYINFIKSSNITSSAE